MTWPWLFSFEILILSFCFCYLFPKKKVKLDDPHVKLSNADVSFNPSPEYSHVPLHTTCVLLSLPP